MFSCPECHGVIWHMDMIKHDGTAKYFEERAMDAAARADLVRQVIFNTQFSVENMAPVGDKVEKNCRKWKNELK